MIQSQFYPTSLDAQGYSLTDSIQNLTYGSLQDDPLRPYTMGYVPYEDYPHILDLATVDSIFVSGGTNSIEIKSATIPNNMPWGYIARQDTVWSPAHQYSMNIYNDNGTWRPQWFVNQSAYLNARLINSGYLAKYTLQNELQLGLSISVTLDDESTRNGTNINMTYSVSNFVKFTEGEITIDLTYDNTNYSLSYEDFNENGIATKRTPQNDGNLEIGITDFNLSGYGDGTGAGGSTIITPYLSILTENGLCYTSLSETLYQDIRFNTGNGSSAMNIQAMNVNGCYGYYRLYGISGTITYEKVNTWAKNYTSEQVHYVPELNCFRSFTGGQYQYKLTPIIKPKELKVLLSLRLKTLIGSGSLANHHYDESINTNRYNEQNVPTGEILNGTYASIVARLRPWQLWDVDITANDFNPDDIPPYTPPSPDGDNNTESGDKIPNQFGRTVGVTSNFVTNYLMTEGQISKLGEVLWTSWADDTVTMDMVNNFYGKFHDATGSWNVSDALQFIVSCRLFPCSLATLVNTTQVSSIPIGTGAFALQCGTSSEPNFFIANEATAILNCGEVYVPRAFNDYRDFENTKVTAYLPFCGSVELNPQDVVDKWLGCTYAIDLFDGSCKAFIYTLSGDDVGYEGAYYNVAIKQGQCGFLIPLSATQAGQVASRQKVDSYTDGALLFNAGMSVIGAALESTSGGSPDTGVLKAISTIGNYGFKSDILSAQRSGRPGIAAPYLSGGSGFTDFHQPASAYIQIRRSYYQEPIEYEHSAGYPVNAQIYGNLSQFSGFITCSNVDISGFTCHEDERAEIKALLESGVYL